MAHNRVMVIDSTTMLTGSCNCTKAAEEKNVENLLVIKDAPELVKAYEAKRLGKINGIFVLAPRQRMPCGSSTYCHLEDLGLHMHGSCGVCPGSQPCR